ncbi:MAG: hypothetical protein IJ906_16345, partial [Oscillospiraceae bacterium]|nr:hypothetical protein [Oscillospiraceae bacterium]
MKLRSFLAVITAVLLLPMQGIPAVAEQRAFTHGVDTWCFGNNPSVLGETYQLTDADRAVMQNSLTHTERRRIEQILQSASVGYCYGLAVSSILAYNGILSPGEYADHAESLHDVQPSAKTNSMIAYYQQMQCTYAMRQEMIWSKYHETQEERLNKL